jgi:hypothetical protein
VAEGRLKPYAALYVCGHNLDRRTVPPIKDWVNAGGRLFATAGAGLLDEFNAPNPIMRDLLGGIDPQPAQVAADPIRWEKQDLPFAKPVETVSSDTLAGGLKMPVYGAVSKFTNEAGQVAATFADGSPAVVTNTVGKGSVTYSGFLPSLSYFKPAIPLKPVDRGSTDDAMSHFIPTAFDKGASALIGLPAVDVDRPVFTSEPLVEAGIVKAKQGHLISLVNWSGQPAKGLTVMVTGMPAKTVTLASGKPVKTMAKHGSRGPVQYTIDLDVADALILR